MDVLVSKAGEAISKSFLKLLLILKQKKYKGVGHLKVSIFVTNLLSKVEWFPHKLFEIFKVKLKEIGDLFYRLSSVYLPLKPSIYQKVIKFENTSAYV